MNKLTDPSITKRFLVVALSVATLLSCQASRPLHSSIRCEMDRFYGEAISFEAHFRSDLMPASSVDPLTADLVRKRALGGYDHSAGEFYSYLTSYWLLMDDRKDAARVRKMRDALDELAHAYGYGYITHRACDHYGIKLDTSEYTATNYHLWRMQESAKDDTPTQ